ncbi:Protein lifeguard 1 [Lamellibrachia satsuma]|nr:Protein lifeguard 1 [Lamellibrachia satsuma]
MFPSTNTGCFCDLKHKLPAVMTSIADDDFNTGYNFEFTDNSIRLGFIRKVYSILLCQLLVTIAFICVFLYVGPVQDYSEKNQWLFIVAIVASFVLLLILACCPDVRRNHPTNIILLGLFTICESFLLGSISSHYEKWEVLMAVGVTAVVVFGLTVFAMQTKIDFTMCSAGLFIALLILMIFGIMCAIIRNYYVNMVYACIGALIFAMYIVFDTQMMMGGKHKYSISPEEYIFAALNLYLDIVNLFLFILSIIGSSRK